MERNTEALKMFALKWDADEEKKVIQAESRAKDVRSVMKSMRCTKEKAMELLEIPADLQPKILTML